MHANARFRSQMELKQVFGRTANLNQWREVQWNLRKEMNKASL